jgi:ABC-type sugar transport system substrate-binding protein
MAIKRLTLAAGAALLGSALAFGGEAAADKVRVGYAPSVWDPSDFHGMMGSGIEMGLQEHGVDYEFMIRAPANHVAHEEQLGIVEDMIAEGLDVIIINPTDPEAQRVAYQKVLESGIPLVVGNYSVPFPDDWGFQPMMFSGYSHSDAGVVLANYLAEKHGAGTTLAIIHGAPGHITYERAPTELYAELGLEVVYEDFADYDRLKAYDAMERILVAYPDVEVIVATSSAMAVGAVEATVANGVAGEYAIYGAGGTFEELRYIEDGLLTAAWIRDPVAMGKAVGEAIWLIKEGRTDDVPPIFNSPIHMIDSIEAINEHVNPALYEAEGMEFPRPLRD